jgi:hypothetical protein
MSDQTVGVTRLGLTKITNEVRLQHNRVTGLDDLSERVPAPLAIVLRIEVQEAQGIPHCFVRRIDLPCQSICAKRILGVGDLRRIWRRGRISAVPGGNSHLR